MLEVAFQMSQMGVQSSQASMLISLHPINLVKGEDDFISVFMFLFEETSQKSFHLLVEGDGICIQISSSPGMARARNPVGRLFHILKISQTVV